MSNRSWMASGHISNRALVLVSISRAIELTSKRISSYSDDRKNRLCFKNAALEIFQDTDETRRTHFLLPHAFNTQDAIFCLTRTHD